MAKRISGNTSPSVARSCPVIAPIRFRGMNMSTTVCTLMSGWAACFSISLPEASPYSATNRDLVSPSITAPGCSTFIINRPNVQAMDMLRKNSVKVRADNGPRRARSPNCETPAASDAKTSGITTKNSSRRNT